MKFGKELKERSVRGWEEHYMSYKRFKRIIKKVPPSPSPHTLLPNIHLPPPSSAHLVCVLCSVVQLVVQLKEREELLQQQQEAAELAAELGTENGGAAAAHDEGREWEEMILSRDARKEFFEEIDKELDRVNAFFTEQLEDMNDDCARLMEAGATAPSERSSRNLLAAPASLSSSLPVPSPSFASRILRPLSSPLLPATPFLHRSITVSAQSQLESRSDAILSLYRRYLNLLSFSFVNQQGFIKAYKKYDKYGHLLSPTHLTQSVRFAAKTDACCCLCYLPCGQVTTRRARPSTAASSSSRWSGAGRRWRRASRAWRTCTCASASRATST